MKYLLITCLLTSFALSSCGKKKKQKAQVHFKVETGANKLASNSHIQLLSAGDFGLQPPGTSTDINCFAIMVYKGDGSDQSTCTNIFGETVATIHEVSDFATTGQTVSFTLNPLISHKFFAVGFNATSTANCTNFSSISTTNKSSLSNPVILGTKEYVTQEGAQQVGISLSMTNVSDVNHCTGSSFSWTTESEKYRRLSHLSASTADVTAYEVVESQKRVVFMADEDNDGEAELYSATTIGTDFKKLSQSTKAAGGMVYSFDISPDGTTVAFVGDTETAGKKELFLTPITGGTITKVSGTLAGTGVEQIEYSPDGSVLIFRADKDNSGRVEIYSLNISTSVITKISDNIDASEDCDYFQITPDGTKVVWYGDAETDSKVELFVISISGGSTIKLNSTLAGIANDVHSFKISPNSEKVLYISDQTDGEEELHKVDIDGTNQVKINDSIAAGGDVIRYMISPDSAYVVFTYEPNTDGQREIASDVINGGTDNDLQGGAIVASGDIEAFDISSDSAYVYYGGDKDTNNDSRIYKVAIAGGAVTTLLSSGSINTELHELFLTADDAQILFIANHDSATIEEIYKVSASGGTTTKVSGALVASADGANELITPYIYSSNDRFFYVADKDLLGVEQLYVAPL